jgi:hypothetical protein
MKLFLLGFILLICGAICDVVSHDPNIRGGLFYHIKWASEPLMYAGVISIIFGFFKTGK